ncbi:hypothetical protein GV794_08495 [Nocardia cyriacigeorgica]|uniref:Uncharacterized protein n=1 Tax=Nocardia cyriacigeorgica TaxID=135487 RepID=A0A6P1D8G1_9NOCA|nr:hypothetical protein [Nocardia cyriacigeorgica]NEW40840.1 hypothetical protein [Nocardia cyriacigeorgica]NEW45919.1 hypothetical protein [Nocardia cyriacigeorgica]NEW55690.1 hypothetical protein [Nocardia cyriacigeorgica]
MTDQHPPLRAPGISRLLALVVLLGGIVAMHAGVFSFGHAGAHAHGGTAAAGVATGHGHAGSEMTEGSAITLASHATGSPAAETSAQPSSTVVAHGGASEHAAELRSTGVSAWPTSLDGIGAHEQDCGTGGCGTQGGMHGCVFILSMLGLAIGLVLLFRLAFQPMDGIGTANRHRPARRERPPPWTVPSLSELSILRV